MTGGELFALCLSIFIALPLLCGLVSWEAGRYEHRQHRRNMDAREAVLAVRERQVLERELALGRRAHEIHTMLNMRTIAIENDTTVIQVLDWDELPAS